MRFATHWFAAALVAGAMALAPSVASSQSPGDKAAAQALFEQGKQLASQGDYASACPKLEESQRLDPGAGTMFNLSHCYERIGRTASAWSLFLEVATMMRSDPDREKVARRRASELEPKLSRLTIDVPSEARVDGLRITRDGQEARPAVWGAAIPVDPGSHVIEASAPGRLPVTILVEVQSDGASSSIRIPLLAVPEKEAPVAIVPAPAARPTPAPEPPRQPIAPPQDSALGNDGSGQRTLGLVIGGVGLAGLGVSTILGLGAKSTYDDSSQHCASDSCTKQGLDLRDDAKAQGNTATIVAGIGAAALVGGAVLYFTAPSAGHRESAALSIGPDSITFLAGSRW